MDEETAAQPADWLPYRVRDAFTFFELACLVSRRDPQRVIDAAIADDLSDQAKMRGIKATGGPERPAYPFDPPEVVRVRMFSHPEWMFPGDVAGLLSTFRKATGMQMHGTVSAQRARELVGELALTWPAELATRQPPRAPPVRGLAAAEAQEQNIMSALRSAGFDPSRLPSVAKGRACPAKNAARDSCSYSPSVFEKAWERLTKAGDIRRG
jgi:hypothetical protein